MLFLDMTNVGVPGSELLEKSGILFVLTLDLLLLLPCMVAKLCLWTMSPGIFKQSVKKQKGPLSFYYNEIDEQVEKINCTTY